MAQHQPAPEQFNPSDSFNQPVEPNFNVIELFQDSKSASTNSNSLSDITFSNTDVNAMLKDFNLVDDSKVVAFYDGAQTSSDSKSAKTETKKPEGEFAASLDAVDFYENFLNNVADPNPKFPAEGVRVNQTKAGNPGGVHTPEGITTFTTNPETGLKDTHTISGLAFNNEAFEKPLVLGRVDTSGHEGKVTLPGGKVINFNEFPPETQKILENYFNGRDGMAKSDLPPNEAIKHFQDQLEKACFSNNSAENELIKRALQEFVRGDLYGRFTSFENQPGSTPLQMPSMSRPDFELTPGQTGHLITAPVDAFWRSLGDIIESVTPGG